LLKQAEKSITERAHQELIEYI